MSAGLNLARQPFLNPRPVLRVTILLWILGLAVAAFNVRLYLKHYSGSGATRERLQTLQESLDGEEARVQELRAELNRFDVEEQNEQAEFLNTKIAERSFSWSELFDKLGEVMPAELRVSNLSPQFGRSTRGRSGPQDNEVILGIRGVSKSSEVLLEFVDALFAHRSFREPNLSSESLKDTGLVDFNLSVIYAARAPDPASEVALAETEETAAGESPDEKSADPAPPEGQAAPTAQSAQVVSE